jgi:hypothetical protein
LGHLRKGPNESEFDLLEVPQIAPPARFGEVAGVKWYFCRDMNLDFHFMSLTDDSCALHNAL